MFSNWCRTVAVVVSLDIHVILSILSAMRSVLRLCSFQCVSLIRCRTAFLNNFIIWNDGILQLSYLVVYFCIVAVAVAVDVVVVEFCVATVVPLAYLLSLCRNTKVDTHSYQNGSSNTLLSLPMQLAWATFFILLTQSYACSSGVVLHGHFWYLKQLFWCATH